MKLITDFYTGLDTLNLIIFWGIITIIILLLIFSIVISNKNKKLKNMIKNNHQKSSDLSEDIPIQIKTEPLEQSQQTESPSQNKEQEKINNYNENINKNAVIEEEKKFIAEEHVMEYNKDLFSLTNIKKANEVPNENNDSHYNDNLVKQQETIKIPNAPYQKNVLREMSLNQTSPIGIVKPVKKEEKVISSAKELKNVLSENISINQETNKNSNQLINNRETLKENNNKQYPINNIKDTERVVKQSAGYQTNSQLELTIKENYQQKNIVNKTEPISIDKNIPNNEHTQEKNTSSEQKTPSKKSYLEEVSRNLANAEQLDEIKRTEYEILQEEDAIISYEELMQKKDSIKIVDEEDAVISIEELMNRSNQQEKLYKITEEEENDMFIKELKNFRNDL